MGLQARTVDHWGEWLEVGWRESTVQKRIKVFPLGSHLGFRAQAEAAGFRVDLEAMDDEPPVKPAGDWYKTRLWRVIGETADADPERMVKLRRLMDDAYELLSRLRADDLVRETEAVVSSVTTNVDPVLQEFAVARDGRVVIEDWDKRALLWPQAKPLFRITVSADPRYGIILTGQTRLRRGILRRERWVDCLDEDEIVRRDIGIDWADVQRLGEVLLEEERMLKECAKAGKR